MTREEAIEELERLLRHWDDLENDKRCFWGYDKEAVALALTAGRNFIGMELDPGYFEMAKQRIEEAQAQAHLAWNTRAPTLNMETLEP